MKAAALIILAAWFAFCCFKIADQQTQEREAQNRAEHLCAGHGSTLETFHADHSKRIAVVCTGGVVVIENAP